ncbi:MAG: hypothetical protein V4555_00745 [Acidobacteriota bacterium]
MRTPFLKHLILAALLANGGAAAVFAEQAKPPQPSNEVRVVSTPPKDGWDKAAVIFAGGGLAMTLALVVIGTTGVIVANRTLTKVGEQTKAAQDTATQALRQTTHAINSDRPWMSVQPDLKNAILGNLIVTATNRGKSPAKVTMYMAELVIVPIGETESGPQYSGDGRFDEPQWRLPDDKFLVQEFDGGLHMRSKLAEADDDFLLIQGFVRYEDTISDAVHETRFCWQVHREGKTGFAVRMFSAKGYNVMT